MITVEVLGAPANPWMMHELSIFMAALVGGYHLGTTLKTRRLAVSALVFIAAITASWQDFYHLWAVYVLWNPHFPQLPWGLSPHTTPYKPAFVPFSWAWFFGIAIPLLLALVARVGRYAPRINTFVLSFLIVGPLFWAYDVYVEFNGVSNGWWSYTRTTGPTLATPRGPFPIWYPVNLFVLQAIVFVWLLTLRDEQGIYFHERILRVDRINPGFKRELARAGAMALLFNLVSLLVNSAYPFALRLATRGQSVLVPY